MQTVNDVMYQLTLYIRSNKVISQSVLLLLSTIGVMICMLFINYFLTKQLDTEDYGEYSLFVNIFGVSKVLFNFGFFQSTGRIVALTTDKMQCCKIYGAALSICLLLDLIMNASIIFFLCTFQKYQYLLSVFLLTIPLNWIYLIQEFMELVLQGNNKITILSISRIVPRLLFLMFVVICFSFIDEVSVATCLTAALMSYAIVYIVIIIKLSPDFYEIKKSLKKIWDSNLQFGFNIYIGSVFAVGIANLTGVLISYFISDTSNVGFYNLSLQLATPLTLVPNILATVLFTRFVNENKIKKEYEILVLVICISIAFFLFILSDTIVDFLYGEKYVYVAKLLNYLLIGSLLYGIANFYNKFLLAKGRGKELRNASFVVGFILLISNIFLIKIFGVLGAAYSYILAGLANCLCIFYYYRLSIKRC